MQVKNNLPAAFTCCVDLSRMISCCSTCILSYYILSNQSDWQGCLCFGHSVFYQVFFSNVVPENCKNYLFFTKCLLK